MTENVTNLQKFVPTLPYMVGQRFYGKEYYNGTSGILFTTQADTIFRLYALSMQGNLSPAVFNHIRIRDNLSANRFYLYCNNLTWGGAINVIYSYPMPFELPEGWDIYVGISGDSEITISIYGEIIAA